MKNNSKTLRQERAIQIWKDNGFHGTFNHIMRFGKTREIEMAVERCRNTHPDEHIMLLVPTDIAYQNVKHLEKNHKVEIYTLYSFQNAMESPMFNRKVYLLIIDEIHRFLSDKTVALLKRITASYKLGLTGSKLGSVDRSKLKALRFPVIDVITEEEAIFNKWITDYDEYNIGIDIPDVDKIRYKGYNDIISEITSNFSKVYKKVNTAFNNPELFKGDFELIQACHIGKHVLDSKFRKVGYIEPEKLRMIVGHIMGYRKDEPIVNDYVSRIQTYWNPSNIESVAKTYCKAIENRNRFIKHNVAKVNAVMALSKIIKEPTIVYNDSNDMTDQLYEQLDVPRVRYHSGLESEPMFDEEGYPVLYKSGDKIGMQKVMGKTMQKKLAIESIVSGKALYLITGKSLNESLNLPMVKYIICTSGDTNPTTYDQRVSRGKTLNEADTNKKCVIINLFINDFFLNGAFVSSRDKEKLMLRQDNVKNVVWCESISDFISISKKQ